MTDVIHYGFYIEEDGVLVLQPKGGATVAVDWETGLMGTALCSPLDNFNKHTGRNKALGRLKSKKAVAIEVDMSDKPFEERAKYLARYLRINIKLPARRSWLLNTNELFSDNATFRFWALAMTRAATADLQELESKHLVVITA
jgi:hypothetical protein